MKLLVAIHDVTPALHQECHRLWQLCAARGVAPALFVVPNWHGVWPLEQHRTFVRWLRDCAAEGAEIFLHGERHDEAGLPRQWRDELRAAGRTAREGEFLTLSEAAASERIQRGIDLFGRLGLSPVGFVAPAWLAREETYRAAARAGLQVSDDARGVRLHHRAMQIDAPAVRWSARTRIRAAASAMVATARWHLHHRHQQAPVVRVSLHPADLRRPETRDSLTRELARWTAARATWRYAQL
jgi:predicted deacetylase